MTTARGFRGVAGILLLKHHSLPPRSKSLLVFHLGLWVTGLAFLGLSLFSLHLVLGQVVLGRMMVVVVSGLVLCSST